MAGEVPLAGIWQRGRAEEPPLADSGVAIMLVAVVWMAVVAARGFQSLCLRTSGLHSLEDYYWL